MAFPGQVPYPDRDSGVGDSLADHPGFRRCQWHGAAPSDLGRVDLHLARAQRGLAVQAGLGSDLGPVDAEQPTAGDAQVGPQADRSGELLQPGAASTQKHLIPSSDIDDDTADEDVALPARVASVLGCLVAPKSREATLTLTASNTASASSHRPALIEKSPMSRPSWTVERAVLGVQHASKGQGPGSSGMGLRRRPRRWMMSGSSRRPSRGRYLGATDR